MPAPWLPKGPYTASVVSAPHERILTSRPWSGVDSAHSPAFSERCADTRVPQGDYDQSKTKVLHLSANPAREAQQSRRQDHARLQEECEQLRKLVCALERGGPVPADLEAACLPSSKEVAGRPAPA